LFPYCKAELTCVRPLCLWQRCATIRGRGWLPSKRTEQRNPWVRCAAGTFAYSVALAPSFLANPLSLRASTAPLRSRASRHGVSISSKLILITQNTATLFPEQRSHSGEICEGGEPYASRQRLLHSLAPSTMTPRAGVFSNPRWPHPSPPYRYA